MFKKSGDSGYTLTDRGSSRKGEAGPSLPAQDVRASLPPGSWQTEIFLELHGEDSVEDEFLAPTYFASQLILQLPVANVTILDFTPDTSGTILPKDTFPL